MGGLRAARHDSAVVLVSRRRGPAILPRGANGARAVLGKNVRAHVVALAPAHRAGRAPPLGRAPADQLHLRGHAVANRSRLSVPLPARAESGQVPVGLAGADPRRLLGGLRHVSAARRKLRLGGGGRDAGLAASAPGFCRALEQEHQSRMGLRSMVPEFVPARETFPQQRRRLRHAQFHPHAGHDDPRADRGRLVESQPHASREAGALRPGGRGRSRARPRAATARRVPHREAHLDAVVGAVQRRLVLPVSRGLLRRVGDEELAELVVPAAGHRRELHRGLRHGASLRRLHRQRAQYQSGAALLQAVRAC